MKRRLLKCFGLLLALFTMAGLSLSVFSEDTSALRHNINVIPLYSVQGNNNILNNASVPILMDPLRIVSTQSKELNTIWYTKLEPHSTDDGYKCHFKSYNHAERISVSNSKYSYIFELPGYDIESFTYTGNMLQVATCNAFGSILDPPGISDASYPDYTFGNPNGREWLPYRYEYDGIYRSSTGQINGAEVSTKLTFGDLFKPDNGHNLGFFPDDVTDFDIPLFIVGQSSEYTSGTPVDFRGRFYLDSYSSSSISVGTTITASVKIQTIPATAILNRIPCTFTYHENTIEGEAPYYFDYICQGYLPSDNVRLYGFTLNISGTPYIWSLSDTNMLIYDTSYVITNGDDTLGEDYALIKGSNVDTAPGSIYDSQVSTDNINWFSSLTHLFSFGFINPFTPLFTMFSDNNSCVSIPTVASMIHSEETTVCPWFSASVRNIVTPVLGIAGMMLIFGFAVRWLGSSSGNMFEDQTSHKWGNTQFKQKGVK